MSETDKIDFKLKTIELLDAGITLPSEPLKSNEVFQFDINLESKSRKEDHFLIVLCRVQVFDQNKKHQMGIVRTSCVFEIQNWKDFFLEDKQLLDIPHNIMMTFSSLAISTTRGIMFSYFRGTFLHNAILPIVDPKTLVKSS